MCFKDCVKTESLRVFANCEFSKKAFNREKRNLNVLHTPESFPYIPISDKINISQRDQKKLGKMPKFFSILESKGKRKDFRVK